MKKLLAKIIGATTALAMAIGMGVGITNSKQARELDAAYSGSSPWAYTFATADVTTDAQPNKTLNNVSWSISSAVYKSWDATKGIQIGSGSNPQTEDWTMTAAISQFGTNIGITSISVGISTASKGGIAWSLTAGGNNGTNSTGSSDSAITSVTTKTATYTTPVESGNVVIALNSNSKSKAIYIHDISIGFTSVGGGDPTPTTYSVTYNSTGSTSGTVPTDANTYESGDSITVAGNTGALAKTGYTWSGWSLNPNGSGTAYGPTYTTTYTVASSNINFYPIWVAEPEPLPESGTITLDGSNPTLGNYGTDVAYVAEEDSTPNSAFGFSCTSVTKGTGGNAGKVQFKASEGVLYSTTPLSYLRSVTVSGANTSDAVIKYGTQPNAGCTDTIMGTRSTYFKITNSAGNARYWTITIIYSLEDPETLTGLEIASGAESVQKTYDDGEEFNPTGLVIQAEWNNVLDTEHNVLNDVVWTPNPLTAGDTQVTGTYTHATGTETVTISGLTVRAPNFVHTYSSNSVYNQTSGSSSETRTFSPSSGPEYITLGGYNYSGNDGCMSFMNVDGMYLGNNEEYSVESVKKYIRKIVITTTSNVTSSLTMTEGQEALPTSSPVVPVVSADNKTLTYVFSDGISFFKLAKSGTSYVNLKSISVYLGNEIPVISSVSASVNDNTYYAGTTLSGSVFNVTVNWTAGKAATHPSEGFTWTVNGVLNGTLSERNDNAVVVTYEGVPSATIYVVGSPAPAKDIIENNAQTQAALSYHYSRDDHLVTDTLTRELTGVPAKTDYVSWEDISDATSAVYAGRSAGGNDTLQLNSNSSDKGIITTTSGGKAKSVSIAWNDSTGSGRVLNVYGKNTAYTAVSQLYDDGAGTLLGTIVYGTSTSLTINGDYQFIAIKSNSGAAYLDSVQIEWATADPTYEYTNTKIQFGGYISQTLWNNLNSSSTIVEYGFLLSTESFLHTDDPDDDESLKLWYDLADQVSVKKFWQEVDGDEDLPYTLLASEHAEISEDQYVWRLTKTVTSLTEQYVAVAYIKTANGDLIFMNQIKKSAKDLAGGMLPSRGNDFAEGSLYNLAHLGE